MSARTIAQPIFDSEPAEIAISNPLPKCKPLDIVFDDSDDSSIEEIPINLNRPRFIIESDMWTWIAEFNIKDNSQKRYRYDTDNSVSQFTTEYAKLTNINKKSFAEFYRPVYKVLTDTFNKKQVWDKLERKLNQDEQQSLLVHIIMRGKSFYDSIKNDPLFAGYLVHKNRQNDEFTTFSNFVNI